MLTQQERNRRISEGLRLSWKRRKAAMNDERPGRYDDPSDHQIPPSLLDARVVAVASVEPPMPHTHEEARQFHEGFLAGATAYAAAVGHSCFKSDNPQLCEVFDAQGWRTIETFEKLNNACEHGVKDGEYCKPCNLEYKRAAKEAVNEEVPEGTYFKDDLDGGRLVGKTPLHGKPLNEDGKIQFSGTARSLTCANCSEVSTNPGQFVRDGRWVCCEACRKELCEKQSYDDLAASGGIVDAP